MGPFYSQQFYIFLYLPPPPPPCHINSPISRRSWIEECGQWTFKTEEETKSELSYSTQLEILLTECEDELFRLRSSWCMQYYHLWRHMQSQHNREHRYIRMNTLNLIICTLSFNIYVIYFNFISTYFCDDDDDDYSVENVNVKWLSKCIFC